MENLELEKKLSKRLKGLGILLLVFSLVALWFHFFPFPLTEEEVLLEEALIAHLAPPPPLNLLLTSAAFFSVGSTCLAIARRKRDV